MMRNIKVLGLALMAVLALTAVAASAAQAVEFHSESASTTSIAKAEGPHVFDAAGLSISCSEANFTATGTATTEETQTFVGGYGGCQFLGISVPVNMGGCDYVFHANGQVDIKGTSCTNISFEGPGCKVTVPAQNGLGTATFNNIGSGTTRQVTMEPNVVNIKYTSSGILCGKRGTFTDGHYTEGDTVVKGESGGSQVGIWVE